MLILSKYVHLIRWNTSMVFRM